MAEKVTCTVCGQKIGKGPGGLGLAAHGKVHRRQFRERYGRPPTDYDEVRELLSGRPREPPEAVAPLSEFVDEGEP